MASQRCRQMGGRVGALHVFWEAPPPLPPSHPHWGVLPLDPREGWRA